MDRKSHLGAPTFFALSISAFVAAYAAVFARAVPSGDAYRNEGRILAGDTPIDPNHVLFDPLLLSADNAARSLGLELSTIHIFAALSVLCAITSALLFYRMLLSHPDLGKSDIQLAVAGLLASNAFLSLTVSDEPFLIQLPFIILASGALHHWRLQNSESSVWSLVFAGVWMAVATLFSIHNVILAVTLALFVLYFSPRPGKGTAVAAYLTGGLAIGLPAFVTAYILAAPDAGFVAWLVTYTEGASGITAGVSNVIGLESLLLSIARIGNAIVDAFAYDGGLAAIAKRELFGMGRDFLPDYQNAFWGGLNVSAFILMAGLTMTHGGQSSSRSSAMVLLFLAISSYSLFGLFWSGKAAQFWVPVVPFFWLLLATTAAAESPRDWLSRQRYLSFIAAGVIVLLTGNTWLGVAPAARFDVVQARHDYRILLEPADVLFVPGWDHDWTLEVHRDLGIPVYHLYEMAILNPTHPPLEDLELIVRQALAEGRTVYITRLYDIDHLQRPWNQLEQIEWPRSRILSLLDGYCAKLVGTTHEISVRHVRVCEEGL